MTLKEIIENDLRSIASDMGNPSLEWNGEQYECLPSTNAISLSLEMGGFAVEADIIFTIRKELFSDGITPANQQKLTYRGVTYRILQVKEDTTGAFIRLICVDNSRGV